ncbi:hypothetical protein RHSIM_Rhsim07G0157100 [Rhododendron simsii]|uniref:AFG1-like ATPase n=1 Tax=Rhododendron simsii TaxID=118357 RepID=A0A834GKE3_RHOSS|nr:hypothetical protein RHSIM_Rhsim07G0157100 [Rhododendron simsii]
MRGFSLISSVLSRSLTHTRRTSEYQINVLRFHSDLPPPSLSGRLGPYTRYKDLVEQGKLQHDSHQEKVALELDNLLGRLEQYENDMEEYHLNLSKWEETRENERRRLLTEEAEGKQKGGVFSSVNKHRSRFVERWMSRTKPENVEPGVGKWVSYLNRERKLDSLFGRRPTAPPAPKGLYLYGNVGSGKTMLMDMFYSATEGIVKHRRRFHFHEAMLQIHEHMHKIWKNQVEEKSLQSGISSWIMNLPFDTKVKEWIDAEERYNQEVYMKNILPAVADKFLVDWQANQRGASILCFDEIQTVDVFAIVALSGIVSRLLSTGTILVATSNRAPRELNQDGMQQEIFLKFLAKLEDHCETVPVGSEIDYRRIIAQTSIHNVHYFWPLDSIKINEFENVWNEVARHSKGRITSDTIAVMFGRTLEVPQCCNGVARFTFEYLCGRPVGAADYIAIAKNFHTVFISDIPMMSMRIRDKGDNEAAACSDDLQAVLEEGLDFALAARRFITLIDELYNYHCSLFCTAAASIDDLFQGTEEGKLFDLERQVKLSAFHNCFQFETETQGGKLRRNVLESGDVSSGGAPAGIISMLSGEEEMFAFRRAVSRLIEMQTPLYLGGVRYLHPYFQKHQSCDTKKEITSLSNQLL